MPQPYWDIRFQSNTRLKEDDSCVELRERMSEAVKIRLVADVPLGAFLSGGVDSSSVVSMMAQHSTSPVNTCSIGFDVPERSEEHTSELQSLMRISSAVFCLKKKTKTHAPIN